MPPSSSKSNRYHFNIGKANFFFSQANLRLRERLHHGIHFTTDNFTFRGRTKPGTDLRPDAWSLDEVIDWLLEQLLKVDPQSQEIHRIGTLQYKSIKIILIDNEPPPFWTVHDLVSALTILRDYLEEHDSQEWLNIAISSTNGQKIYIQILTIPTLHFIFPFDFKPGPDRSDRLDMWLYPQEKLDRNVAEDVLNAAFGWIEGHDVHKLLPRGYETHFRLDDLSLDIIASSYSPSALTTFLTYDRLSNALHAVIGKMNQEIRSRHAVFQATIKDYTGKIRGEMGLRRRELVGLNFDRGNTTQ